MAAHVDAMLAFRAMGVPTFDYGNNIRQVAKDEGVTHAFDFPGFVPAYVRPLCLTVLALAVLLLFAPSVVARVRARAARGRAPRKDVAELP